MIRVICPHCSSKIDAPESLLGQRRQCPKCKQDILILADAPRSVATPQTVPVPSSVQVDNSTGLDLNAKFIWRLKPNNLYVIISYERTIAYWKIGDGWMFNTGNGFVSLKRNINLIPEHGNFVFIEGVVEQKEDAGDRLMGIRFFDLSGRSILAALGRSETEILDKVTQKCSLTSNHKRFFLQFLRQNHFNQFTEDAPEIIDFLTNQDFHSQEIGNVTEREPSPLETQN